MCAESVSLSPNFMSCIATVSFSLTMGMMFFESRAWNVRCAFRYCVRSIRLSSDTRTCAMGCETDVKKSSYMRMSRTMPTAAMACLPARSLGFSCFIRVRSYVERVGSSEGEDDAWTMRQRFAGAVWKKPRRPRGGNENENVSSSLLFRRSRNHSSRGG